MSDRHDRALRDTSMFFIGGVQLFMKELAQYIEENRSIEAERDALRKQNAALRAVAEADDERPHHCDGCWRPNDFSHCAGCEHSQENEDWSNRQALKAAAREVGAL